MNKKKDSVTIKIPTKVFSKIWQFIKEKKKHISVASFLIIALMLGIGFDFGYGPQGFHFSCKYTAPKPKDIKQLIPLDGIKRSE